MPTMNATTFLFCPQTHYHKPLPELTRDCYAKDVQPTVSSGNLKHLPEPLVTVILYKEFIKTAICPNPCPQQVELYWYMLEIFTDHDADKDGIIKMAEFPEMMNELIGEFSWFAAERPHSLLRRKVPPRPPRRTRGYSDKGIDASVVDLLQPEVV